MSNSSPIWAKSIEKGGGTPVRLHEHIQDVLGVFDKIKCRVDCSLQVDGSLCDLIRLAIVCHYWGKVLPVFQIRLDRESTRANRTKVGLKPNKSLHDALLHLVLIEPRWD